MARVWIVLQVHVPFLDMQENEFHSNTNVFLLNPKYEISDV